MPHSVIMREIISHFVREDTIMKKFLALALALCISCMAAGCSKQCEHQMTAAVTRKAACSNSGIATYTC